MYEMDDRTADLLVGKLEEKLHGLNVVLRDSKGPNYKRSRTLLRDRIDDIERTIAGINTGEGVTRRGV